MNNDFILSLFNYLKFIYAVIYLADKEDRARIKVETIIREDFVVEAYELLETFCEFLLARFGIIQQMK